MDIDFLACARLTHPIRDRKGEQAPAAEPVPWWSFTKTILAAATVALCRQKGISLDALLPGRPFSLRQLLQHRAGLPEYCHLAEYQRAVTAREQPWPAATLLERVNEWELSFEPGHGWSYSNTGYLLVRQWLEEQTGMSLGSLLSALVFEPLAVPDACVALTVDDYPVGLQGIPMGYHPGWVYHGLVVGPVRSAAVLLHRLLSGDLPGATDTSQLTAALALDVDTDHRPWRAPHYGLGLMIGQVGDVTWSGHTGAGPGSTIAVYSTVGADGVRRTAAASATSPDPAGVEWKVVQMCESSSRLGEPVPG